MFQTCAAENDMSVFTYNVAPQDRPLSAWNLQAFDLEGIDWYGISVSPPAVILVLNAGPWLSDASTRSPETTWVSMQSEIRARC